METTDYYRGEAELYNIFRPSPPEDFVPLILQLFGKPRVELVIDLGSGTGLSSYIWRAYAKNIIGIEPNKNYLSIAHKNNTLENINYTEAFSNNTGIDSVSADIVTAVNSLHWMDLKPTFKEIFRLLKPDGLFVMLGALYFTILDFETNKKFHEILDNADKIIIDRGYNKNLQISVPDQIDKYMYNRKYFKYALEFVLLGREKLNIDRFIGRLKTLGEIATCIKNNCDEISGQIVKFQKYIEETYEDKSISYLTSYEMKVGQK